VHPRITIIAIIIIATTTTAQRPHLPRRRQRSLTTGPVARIIPPRPG
jgi:hypothetical protein